MRRMRNLLLRMGSVRRMVGVNGGLGNLSVSKGETSLICRTIHMPPLSQGEEKKKVLVNGQDLLNRRI